MCGIISYKIQLNMKYLLLTLLFVSLLGCSRPIHRQDGKEEVQEVAETYDSLINVAESIIDSIEFIRIRMNPEAAYITMADSVSPSENDLTIALCVEAAFTGELLKEFKSSNVAGDYVIDGIFHKGYKCKANTGFLYADKSIFTISSSEYCTDWIIKAQENNGCLFQQILLVKNGRNVYKGNPIKPDTPNFYRSACIMNDGNFAIIQSQSPLPLKSFIESLMAMGVSDALYLDMGKGWNYGWYRETVASAPIKLFDYKSPYQTNWLIIKAKD